MSLVKLAKKNTITIPVTHLKGDTKEINEMREFAQRIIKITKEMNAEDKKAMK